MTIVNHECYVSLEVVKLLKKTGFDWECRCYYETSGKLRGKNSGSFSNHNSPLIWQNNGNTDTQLYSAPTLDVAQRWLREVKGVEVYAHVFYDTYDTSEGWDVYVYEVNHIIKQIEDWINSYDVYHSYEEAQEAGIKKVLELILEKGE